MRKPYIAPSCEYMTFTVDSAIASNSCSNKGTFGSEKTCTWVDQQTGDILFSDESIGCLETDVEGLICYYGSTGISIFGS